MSNPTGGRKPWVAAVLSLVSTGLGHIYCGRIVKGLVLFSASLLFAPLAVGAALLPASTAILVALLLGVVVVVGLYLYAVVDAWVLASARMNYEPRDYNHPAVYLLLGLVGLLYPPGAALVLRAQVFEAFQIPSANMVPTILDGDRVLVNKLVQRAQTPERGDLVVFRVPGEPGRNWIKRVIALPGDRVEVRSGEVFVNDKKLARDPMPASHLRALGGQATGAVFTETNAGRRYLVQLGGGKGPDFAVKTTPEGTYFVLGDNRDRSKDSREFGFVARGELVGLVQYLYLPAESWQRFGVLRE